MADPSLEPFFQTIDMEHQRHKMVSAGFPFPASLPLIL